MSVIIAIFVIQQRRKWKASVYSRIIAGAILFIRLINNLTFLI